MAAAILDAKRAALGDISNHGASGLLAAAGDKVLHARGPPRSWPACASGVAASESALSPRPRRPPPMRARAGPVLHETD